MNTIHINEELYYGLLPGCGGVEGAGQGAGGGGGDWAGVGPLVPLVRLRRGLAAAQDVGHLPAHSSCVNEHSRSFTLPGATIALSEESLLNGGANTVSWHDIALGHLFTKIITENHTGLLMAL